ncbi:HAD family hydrolase [Paenibacillus sp. CCS19]|uniref:HAD family hydrolase n=1 Tax=Paenibacillus sp. CCS19 TaxID=3158387 RepID=UPI00295F33BA|nr:HAD family hydrolase [Paenibacillus cellulosilyticus]
MHEIKHFFFDMDDTLYDQMEPFRMSLIREGMWTDKEWAEFDRLFKRVRHHSDELWDDYVAGKMTLEETRRLRLILAFAEYDIKVSDELADRLQLAYEAEQRVIQPSAGIVPLLEAIRARGHDIGIITNGPVVHQTRKIDALGVRQFANEGWVFVSDALGMAKPDPRLFAEVNRRTGTKPENCIYIGDNWRNDIVGSCESGWSCVWLNNRGRQPESHHRPTHEVSTIEDMTRKLLGVEVTS